MPKQTVRAEGLAAPSGPYSLAARAGDVIFVGGLTGQDASGDLAGGPDHAARAAAQGRAMFNAWRSALKALGGSPADVAQCRFYVADWLSLQPLGDPYKETFPAPHTARTTVRSASLPGGAQAQGGAIAVLGSKNQVLGHPDLFTLPVPLAQAGVKAGNWFFSTGLFGVDKDLRPPHGIAAQTDQSLQNLSLALEAAEMTLDDVVKANIFIADPRDLEGMLASYSAYFRPPYPALTIAAQTLARPDCLVEIELVAASGEKTALLAPYAEEGAKPGWTSRPIEGLPPADQAESAAVLCDGWLYTGALMGYDVDGHPAGDLAAQARSALDQLQTVLGAAGMELADVVATGVVLTDLRHLSSVNQVYAAAFASPYPVQTVAEGGTVHQELLVQVEAYARAGGDLAFVA